MSAITKVDLVIWTKNGSRTLPLVLKRIAEVIPENFVHNRIIVDDGSTDDTREIAKNFGWRVFLNEGKGISDGANTALKHVEAAFFISFEQDVLLAREWWQKVPRHLLNAKVAIASGVRLSNQPLALRKLQEYATERYQRREKEPESFFYGKTLDNTIYRTDVIRRLGGFPHLPGSVGVDSFLAQRVHSSGYEWKVDFTVRSTHLRTGLKDELTHQYWYSTCGRRLEPILFNKPLNLKGEMLRTFFSPIRGLQIAVKKKAPQIVYIYPLVRFAGLKGALEGEK